jgi:hypothetical protein
MLRTVPQSVFDSAEARKIQRQAVNESISDLGRKHPSQLDSGNPNHPIFDGIFGYDVSDFMAKQYR